MFLKTLMNFDEIERFIRDEDLEKLEFSLSKMNMGPLDFKRLIGLSKSKKVEELIRGKYATMKADVSENYKHNFVIEDVYTGDAKKDKSMKMFFDAFKINISNCDDKRAALLARQITIEIFGKQDSDTAKLIRSKCLNLKDKDNPGLCKKVYNGNISPFEYVSMTAEDMKSENLKSEEVKMLKDSFYECQIPTQKAETDIFKCSKCGERKCSYRQLQTRSSDEPMTTFVTCECGHRWKFC